MSGNDSNSRVLRYERLKRRLSRFNPSSQYAVALKFAAEEILEDNPIGSEGSPEEIAETFKSLLPAPQTVFTAEFFRQPFFPVALAKDVATLYDCLQIDEKILDDLSEEKKLDSVLMANVWLAHAYDPTIERVLMVIDMYETTRIFNRLTLTMPLGQTPAQTPHRKEKSTPILQKLQTPESEKPMPILDTLGTTKDDSVPPRVQRNRDHNDHPRSVGDPTKKAVAVEQYFRSTKYNGDLTQSLQNTIRDYNVCAMQLELSSHQKALLFINVFGGTARDYFFEHCREEMSYEQLVDVMKKGFDNNARQLAIESELENLTLEKIMGDNNTADVNEGLTKLADNINSLFPQMPIQSQYPKNKVRFLRRAVLEQDWAKASIAQIVTSNFKFDDLLTSLREQYQLEREVREAKSKSASLPSTLYQQYGRNPKRYYTEKRNGSAPSRVGQKRMNPIGRDGKRMKCSMCGSPEHFVRDCPPGASRNYVRSSLGKGIPAVHLCHDLLKGIEELGIPDPDDSTQDDDQPSPRATEENSDGPSELHLFDHISSASETQNPEESEDIQTGLFEKIDESIATNFISSKFAGSGEVSAPQVIFHSEMHDEDFRQNV